MKILTGINMPLSPDPDLLIEELKRVYLFTVLRLA